QGFPSALTILIWVIVGVWLVALVIPSGQYRLDESGHPSPGSFQEIDSPLTSGASVRELLLSPINALYGIQHPEPGQAGPCIVGAWPVVPVIPAGQYRLDEGGRPIPGSFQESDSPVTFGASVRELLLSPVNGPYGIQGPEAGQVGPFNAGGLFGSAQVLLFIL